MKKNIHKWFVPTLLSALILFSCDNYLDVQPKGVQLITNVADYDQWLNCTDLEASVPNEINFLGDNIDNPTIPNLPFTGDNRIYTWQRQLSEEVGVSPLIWADHYKSIYYFNTVIQGINDATGGTEDQKKSLKAEALLGRAFEYLYLVNLYGKPYDTATADEDLAVPFVTSNDINKPVPDRSTVNDIYAYIISDITTALPDLPQNNSQNRFRGSVASAYSVLARTYLYKGDYTKAAQNAQLALDNGPDAILDYSLMSDATDIAELMRRPDAIYARYAVNYFREEIPAIAFLQSFDTTDLRLKFYYGNLDDYSFINRNNTLYEPGGVPYSNAFPNCGTSVAEMHLIIAEAAARANDLPTAIQQLDLVRKCRFRAADYVKYDPANPVQEDVLQKVLQERTFEFPYCGMRWFDMRRLDAEGRMPEVNRYDGNGNVIATLPAHSNKYTLQIPLQVMYFNPDWPQNLWDEE